MSETLHIEILTATKTAFRGDAAWIEAKTLVGRAEVLPGHADMIAVLDIGLVKLCFGHDLSYSVAVHGGVMQVSKDRVLILAEEAEHPKDIDAERAKAELAEAKRELEQGTAAATDRFVRDKLQAEARLGAFESYRDHKSRGGGSAGKGTAP